MMNLWEPGAFGDDAKEFNEFLNGKMLKAEKIDTSANLGTAVLQFRQISRNQLCSSQTVLFWHSYPAFCPSYTREKKRKWLPRSVRLQFRAFGKSTEANRTVHERRIK